VVTKDPFASIHSIYRYFRRRGRHIRGARSWSAFLRSRIVIYDDHQTGSPQFRFQNPVQLWNDLNWNFTRFEASGFQNLHVRYLDLLVDPQATLSHVTRRLELPRKSDGDFELPTNKVRRMSEDRRSGKDEYVRQEAFDDGRYYREAEYMAHYDADDIRFVTDNLDHELVRDLGYAATIERACALAPGLKRRSGWARFLGR
jgi:hypothetical protein